MDTIKPRLGEVIDERVRLALLHAHTNIPAKVVSYDASTNTLTAKPVTKVPYLDSQGEAEYDELPAIPNVPVMWPRGGGKIVRMNLEAGDFVWLSFSEAALSEWRTTGQLSEPADARRFSIGYPYAIPGAFPDTLPLSPADAAEVAAGAVLIGEDGDTAQMIVGGTVAGVRFGKSASSPIALANPTDDALSTLASAISDLSDYIKLHTHPVPALGTSSAPTNPPPVGPSTPDTTASTLVKSL